MSDQIDTFFSELTAISDELSRLGPDDHERKEQLLARREELRKAARLAGDEARSKEDLERELEDLERRLRQAEGQHIDVVTQTNAAMGDTMTDLAAARHINEMIDENAGVDEIQERIAQIKEALAKKG